MIRHSVGICTAERRRWGLNEAGAVGDTGVTALSSAQAGFFPASTRVAHGDYAPIPPEHFSGTILESLQQADLELLGNEQGGHKGDEDDVADEDGVDDENDNGDSIAATANVGATRCVRSRLCRHSRSEARGSYGGVLVINAVYTWNLCQRFANYDDSNRLRQRGRINLSYPS